MFTASKAEIGTITSFSMEYGTIELRGDAPIALRRWKGDEMRVLKAKENLEDLRPSDVAYYDAMSPGLPAISIKGAFVDMGTQVMGKKMANMVRRAIVISKEPGEIVPIRTKDEPMLLIEEVKTRNKTPKRIPYLEIAAGWTLRFEYSLINNWVPFESFMDIWGHAGERGVGFFRPAEGGTHGTFKVLNVQRGRP